MLRLARALQAMQRMSEAMRLLHHERRNFPQCGEMQRLHEATRLALRALDGLRVGVKVGGEGGGPVGWLCAFGFFRDWNKTGGFERKSVWLAACFCGDNAMGMEPARNGRERGVGRELGVGKNCEPLKLIPKLIEKANQLCEAVSYS